MKKTLKILASKKIRELLKMIKEQWAAEFKPEYGFLKSEKEKIYIISKDIAKLELEKIRINSVGLYFAEHKKGDLRLSIEGSQIIGPKAKKNVLDINKKQALKWIHGEDLDVEPETKLSGFIIIKHNDDFLGSGKFKEDRIINFVPKARRLTVTDLP